MGLRLFSVVLFSLGALSLCHAQRPTFPPGACIDVKDVLRKIPKEGLEGLIQTAGSAFSHLLKERLAYDHEEEAGDEDEGAVGSRGISLLPLLNFPDPFCRNVPPTPQEGVLPITLPDGTDVLYLGFHFEKLTDLEIIGLSTLVDDLSLRFLPPVEGVRETWDFDLEWVIDLGSLEVLEDFHNTFLLGLPTQLTNFTLHFDGEDARLLFQDCQIYLNVSGVLPLLPFEGKTFFLKALELQANCPVLDWTATWDIDVGIDVEDYETGIIDSVLCKLVDNAETDIGDGLAGIINLIWNLPTTGIPECGGYATGPCIVKAGLNILFKNCTIFDIIGNRNCTLLDPTPVEGEGMSGALGDLDLSSFFTLGVNECPAQATETTTEPTTKPPASSQEPPVETTTEAGGVALTVSASLILFTTFLSFY